VKTPCWPKRSVRSYLRSEATKLESLKQIFEVALETIAINSSNKQKKENK
jgi:hypothetical protein